MNELKIQQEIKRYEIKDRVIDVIREDNSGEFFSRGGFGIIWKDQKDVMLSIEEFYNEEDLRLIEIGLEIMQNAHERNSESRRKLKESGEII